MLNNSEKSLKEKLQFFFLRNNKNAIIIRILNLFVKLLTCLLYVVDISIEKFPSNHMILYRKYLHSKENSSNIDWENIGFVNRSSIIRYFQFSLACYGIIELALFLYLYNGKHRLKSQLTNSYFLIEILTTVPWIIEMSIPEAKNIFIPVFLNIWCIRHYLKFIFNDLNILYKNQANSLSQQQLIQLIVSVSAIAFTSACGFQHLQRGSNECVTILDSFYYIVITLSSVGYGDIVPTIWINKLFMSIMILIAIILIPKKIEELIRLWFEKQSLVSLNRSIGVHSEKPHVVICATAMDYNSIAGFLKEFYSHRRNQTLATFLLSTSELDNHLKSFLHMAVWKKRIFYVHGSPLKNKDLDRVRMSSAEAVFLISTQRNIDKEQEDQYTILRSWAIKEYCKKAPPIQYIQIFNPENKIHLKFADHVICEEEFKYALLASNCLCPGLLTFINLLLNKKIMKEKLIKKNQWNNVNRELAGKEIHSIVAGQSKIFSTYVGTLFCNASYEAHKNYNVCLIGIMKPTVERLHRQKSDLNQDAYSRLSTSSSDSNESPINIRAPSRASHIEIKLSEHMILLNPGSNYIIEKDDICFYISLNKEENFDWKSLKKPTASITEILNENFFSGLNIQEPVEQDGFDDRTTTQAAARAFLTNLDSNSYHGSRSDQSLSGALDLKIDTPKNKLYMDYHVPLCKLLKKPSHLCCLELNRECDHKTFKQASDYMWKNQCVILATDNATNGLFSFLLPLRAHLRSENYLKPIVFLLKNRPTRDFLDSISCFPLVYWLQGSINDINTVLTAGISESEMVVITSKERSQHINDECLVDSPNIFACHKLRKLFPNVKIVVELANAANTRFLKFEENENIETLSNVIPFISEKAFSTFIVKKVLCQTFTKPYLMDLIHCLIGINRKDCSSGSLTCMRVSQYNLSVNTYGSLYEELTKTNSQIPLGICRSHNLRRRNGSIYNNISQNSQNESSENIISLVLINPCHDFILEKNDIIYILKPAL